MLFKCRPEGLPIPGRFPGPAHARGKWFTIDIHCHLLTVKAEEMVAEAARLGEAGRVHEQHQAQFLGALEDRSEARFGEIGAGDIGGDLDAAQSQRFVQPVDLGDGELGRLERHRAIPGAGTRRHRT